MVYKIMFEDVVVLAATWANLLLWRGAWDLCLAYVIPDPVVGGWICHWVGTVSLILLQVSHCLALQVRGHLMVLQGIFFVWSWFNDTVL